MNGKGHSRQCPSLSHEALWFLFFRLCGCVFLAGETRHVWTVDIIGLNTVNVFLLKVSKGSVVAFSGCLFSSVVRRRLDLFSWCTLDKNSQTSSCRSDCSSPLFKLFFSKDYSSKVTKKRKQRPYANWLRQGWHLDYCREKNQHYLSLIYFNTEKLLPGTNAVFLTLSEILSEILAPNRYHL